MTTFPAELVTLADAMVVDLQASSDSGAFNRQFEANVLWANRTIELESLNVLRVDIAPIGWDQSVEARGYFAMLCHFDVGVRKRFDVSEQNPSTGVSADEEVKQLLELLSDLVAYYMPSPPLDQGRRFTGIPEAVWQDESGGITPVTIDWKMLRTQHQFTGFFPLTYQMTRDTS